MARGATLTDIGEVEGQTAQGKFLVRLSSVPRIGDRLFDPRGRPVAIVRDVIGNVERPLAVVEPADRSSTLRLNSSLLVRKGRGTK